MTIASEKMMRDWQERHSEEVTRLRLCLRANSDANMDYADRNADLAGRNKTLVALNAELAEALEDCANDLESELNGRYDKTLDYPSQKRRYDRDMEPVVKARAALAKMKEGK